MEYYIFVSNDCNLNCRYCSVMLKLDEFQIPPTPQYSIEELNSFICKIQEKYLDEIADIVFFWRGTYSKLSIYRKINCFSAFPQKSWFYFSLYATYKWSSPLHNARYTQTTLKPWKDLLLHPVEVPISQFRMTRKYLRG